MKKITKLIHAGRTAAHPPATVNLPVARASTVLFESLDHLAGTQKLFDAGERIATYGIVNMPQRNAFEELVCALEGGHRAVTVPSGLAAVAVAIIAAVKAGDHVLMVDSVYGPSRQFCDRTLAKFGVRTTYYDPLASGEQVAALMRPETSVVYVESPGSLTFEVQDIPAIAKAAHAQGALVIADNAWATGLLCPVMDYGVDLVVQPATKYLGGHSDVILGAVVANERAWPLLHATSRDLGQTASPDDIYLMVRGMRTLAIRLEKQGAAALDIARWLQGRPEVKRVLHPGLESDPGHALWKRDFKGSSGLFGVELQPCTRAQVAALVDHCGHFGIGYSWGGFESLIIPANLRHGRQVRPWDGGPLIRLHIGLEDPADLMADLDAAFARWRAAA
ncbi:MAG TPA: cystathionine beta-lyase [Usitatibacteraceae bacterium]|nr:cystathionine beta-lyase [Usitatibacteraceae bacterium]